jgi:hypothetical protein
MQLPYMQIDSACRRDMPINRLFVANCRSGNGLFMLRYAAQHELDRRQD